ncbi:T9SS type A sorting domain-containing protein [Dyadobacter chenhuakuii]|uniref:T9SS type A sorting domain-containing protein n=1 Tax=Dyadobacter chenhuakuii TaxID=2909339 RepID=A0A9X1TUC7_9BACT|nr:T9SS type A sorting domain-containing protein [Dyadobacter chenhuakuii]MCF2501189.1 T9SS type A sorting domain-containing protein [Dyadobacter chenhuakuii]
MKKLLFILIIFAYHNFCEAQSAGHISAERKSSIGKVTFVSTSSITSYYVDGYVQVSGASRFTFPVGDNGRFRPFAVSADGTLGAYYGANPSVAVTSNPKGGNYGPLPLGAPFPTSQKEAAVKVISTKEYWDINGSTKTRITLTWDSQSGIAQLLNNGNLTKLYIVGWDGKKWVKIASTYDATSILGGQSSHSSGSITTNLLIVPNTYNVYTFGADPASTAAAPALATTSFSGSANNQRIKLEWNTDSITAIKYTVEKSTDSTSWEQVASVAAVNSVSSRYFAEDLNPAKGKNFYRLKTTFPEGTVTRKPIFVKFGRVEEVSISIYPNPASDRVFVQGANFERVRRIVIQDLTGKTWIDAKSADRGIDVRLLSSGIYILSMENLDGIINSKKLIINK